MHDQQLSISMSASALQNLTLIHTGSLWFALGSSGHSQGCFRSQNRADFPLGRGKGLSSGLDPSYPFSKVSLTWENGISMSAGCCNGLTCELCVGKSGTFLV